MHSSLRDIDAHEQPSDELRAQWKRISKAESDAVLGGGEVDDVSVPAKAATFRRTSSIPADRVSRAFGDISDGGWRGSCEDAAVYHHPILPGLLIVPGLLPPEIQTILLSKLLHRDLSNPRHQTNMHLHFNLPYPSSSPPTALTTRSFFSYPPSSSVKFTPKDPSVHRPLSVRQVLDKRLHWVTLGGQYDWTNRRYPDDDDGEEGESSTPDFPPDVSSFLRALFPETAAQAAIVNIYGAGDTMMMHRDVSEETDRGLISLSLGCDGLFMICPEDWGRKDGGAEAAGEGGAEEQGKKYLLLRLRSGDAMYMTEEARSAWHGVPKILKGTCPDYLRGWPAGEDGEFEEWRGWMENKRVNLNVRQMKE